MLRRLTVRTRLMTVIAVPLVLLLVVVLPEVQDRRAQATAADRAAELGRLVDDLSTAVDALQGERVMAAAARAGAADVDAALEAERALADSAVDVARGALQRVPAMAPAVAEAAISAGAELDLLGEVREQNDAAQSIVVWVDPYAPMLDALLSVQEDVGTIVAGTGFGDDLAQAALLARAKDATAAQSAHLAAATTWGELRGDQRAILTDLRADELAFRSSYLSATPTGLRADRRAELQAGAVTTAGRVVDEVIRSDDVSATGGLRSWLDAGADRQTTLRAIETARAGTAVTAADAVGERARRDSTTYAALVGFGFLLVVALAVVTARSITKPLQRLSDAADDLAHERLPALVDALRNPGEDDDRWLAATAEPIEVLWDDELARLARAFNLVQATAVDVAAQQSSLLRKGISDLYVNLARRNQSLIERQIELLTHLEAGQEDPVALEQLYLLDHLATRMRRNAESLLVLAGIDGTPRRARPIDVTDVVRAALSEVEDYRRVELKGIAPTTVVGTAVSDVAHILAELLENATSFSPPGSSVRIQGTRTGGGGYQLVVSDDGVGIGPAQLDELNAVLRDPPVTGLALGRSLGCLVAARLAARHGVTVRLGAGPAGGTSAVVTLPRSLLSTEEPAAPPAPKLPARRSTGAGPNLDILAALDEHVPVAQVPPAPPAQVAPVTAAPVLPTPTHPAPAAPTPPLPARLRDAVPSGGAFESGLAGLLGEDGADAAPVEPPFAAPTEGAVAERPAPELARRVPGASVGAFTPAPTGDRVRRSPDEVRALLSKYRSGLRAGRNGAPSTTPPPGRQEER